MQNVPISDIVEQLNYDFNYNMFAIKMHLPKVGSTKGN